MNRCFASVLVVSIVAMLGFAAVAANAQSGLPTIAVLGFSGANPGFSQIMREEFTTELVKSKRFQVVDSQGLDKLWDKQKDVTSADISAYMAAQTGNPAGYQLTATGHITDAGVTRETGKTVLGIKYDNLVAKISVNFKVLDITAGEVWAQETVEGKASASYGGGEEGNSLMRKAATEAAKEFIPHIPLARGKVAQVDADGIIVNLGSAQGVTAATEFKVERKGAPIMDPDTGKPIEREAKVITYARPDKASIETNLCKIVPGYWKEIRGPLGMRFEWRPDPDMAKQIQLKDEVVMVLPVH